jgi:hypothetical protein
MGSPISPISPDCVPPPQTPRPTTPTPTPPAHFIKTVEDLSEVMAAAGGGARWGVAFCEASGDPDNADMPGGFC